MENLHKFFTNKILANLGLISFYFYFLFFFAIQWLGYPGGVTRWLYNFSILGHLHQWKIAQLHWKFAKVGSKKCKTLNKLSKNCPNFLRYCQSGEISSKSGHTASRQHIQKLSHKIESGLSLHLEQTIWSLILNEIKKSQSHKINSLF